MDIRSLYSCGGHGISLLMCTLEGRRSFSNLVGSTLVFMYSCQLLLSMSRVSCRFLYVWKALKPMAVFLYVILKLVLFTSSRRSFLGHSHTGFLKNLFFVTNSIYSSIQV